MSLNNCVLSADYVATMVTFSQNVTLVTIVQNFSGCCGHESGLQIVIVLWNIVCKIMKEVTFLILILYSNT